MKYHILLIALFSLILYHCNHARIKFPVKEKPKVVTPPTSMIKITPRECQGKLVTAKQKTDCEEAKKKVALKEEEVKQKQLEEESKPPKEVMLTQDFFLWGYYPKKIIVNVSEVCENRGAIEVYQYGQIRDEVIGQITLGMYMPRTLKITCQK
jgi:hypothetical protein